MTWAKVLADALTLLRGILAISFVTLGLLYGKAVLALASRLLLVSWTSDILDGAVIRFSRTQAQSWVGDHDLLFDMLAGLGLLIYMMAAGFFNPWLGVFFLLASALIFWHAGLNPSLGKLFQAPIYGWFLVVAVREAPSIGWWLVIWIGVAILITWPRFPNEVIPSFLSGMKEVGDQGNTREQEKPGKV